MYSDKEKQTSKIKKEKDENQIDSSSRCLNEKRVFIQSS